MTKPKSDGGRTFDGTNHDEVLTWLVKNGHAVRGGVHRVAPGETDELHFEHPSGTIHQLKRGHAVSQSDDGQLFVASGE